VLTGEAAALEAYLTAAGNLVYNGPGQFGGAAMPVTLTLAQGQQSSSVTLRLDEPQQPTLTDQNIRLRLQAASAEPTMPGWVNLHFPDTSTTDFIVDSADVASGQVIFVEIEAERSALRIAGLESPTVAATGATGSITVASGSTITTSGSPVPATRFIGTAAALNTFFSTAGNVRFNASSGVASVAARVGSYGLAISGPAPVLGAVLTVSGVASGSAVTYTVSSNNLTVSGTGSGGVATADQARAHIAASLAQVINAHADKLVTATAVGSTIQLSRLGDPITLSTSVASGEMQLAVLGSTQTRGQIPIVRPNGAGVTVNLPKQFVFSDQDIPVLMLPSNALATTSTQPITLTLSVSGGTALSWANASSPEVTVSRGTTQGDDVDLGSSVTLTGTVNDLNDWLSSPGNLVYSSNQATTLSASISVATSVGGPVLASSLASAVLMRPASVPTVSVTAPETLTLAPDTNDESTIAFARDPIVASGSGDLTLTLIAPTGGDFVSAYSDDVYNAQVFASAGTDGVRVYGATTVTVDGAPRDAVQLVGTAENLNRYLRATGNLRYEGTAPGTLELRVTNDSGVSGISAISTARILLDNPGARAIPRLALPATVTLVPGADSPLRLGASEGAAWLLGVSSGATNGDTALIQATITASGGVLSTLDQATDGVSVSGATATSVTLSGSVSDLSAWLNAGKLTLRTDAARNVSVELRRAAAAGNTLSALDAALVATGGFSVDLHQPSGARHTSPTVNLPGRLAVLADTDSALTLGAAAFGTTQSGMTLSVTLSATSGSINVASLAANESGTLAVMVGGVSQSVTVSAFTTVSTGGSRSFTGSPAALSALFAEAGTVARVFVNGSAQQSLSVTTALIQSSATVASTTATIELYGALPASLNQIVPVLTKLPTTLPVTPGTENLLRFNNALLEGASASALLELRLALPASNLTLGSGEGLALISAADGALAVTAVSSATTDRVLVIRGTAAQLASALRADTGAARIT
jgi:hypothetical protein